MIAKLWEIQIPRKKTRRKKQEEIYTYIVVLTDHFEAETELGVNSNVYTSDKIQKAENKVKVIKDVAKAISFIRREWYRWRMKEYDSGL